MTGDSRAEKLYRIQLSAIASKGKGKMRVDTPRICKNRPNYPIWHEFLPRIEVVFGHRVYQFPGIRWFVQRAHAKPRATLGYTFDASKFRETPKNRRGLPEAANSETSHKYLIPRM